MRNVLVGVAALMAASLTGVTPGSAQYWSGRGTWCIERFNPPRLGCSYYSLRQCNATLMYGSGSCVPNPAAEWARRGYKIAPQDMPDYEKGRRTERAEGLRTTR
jgi:Protein of unknown function (DUF3551)